MDRNIIINASGHNVTVVHYLYTELMGQEVFTEELPAGTVRSDTFISGRSSENYDPKRFIFYDSIKVVFDHLDTITHYADWQENFSGIFYLFSSTRNLMNINSYQISSTEDKKRQFRTVSYTYTFTEQDYEDAKK